MSDTTTPTRLLRLEAVIERVGLKKTQIYERMRRGEFPRSVKLTPGRNGTVTWVEAEIEEWIRAHIAQSRAA
jgi:prophage regulatory protein